LLFVMRERENQKIRQTDRQTDRRKMINEKRKMKTFNEF